ncbi:hypothetical protein [Microvirga lotononidis]|nr:hypothetical protein [Microvirga lotononidis]WQO30045.1 hypothetical protein U0023_27045 [Microvirga lotononidis]
MGFLPDTSRCPGLPGEQPAVQHELMEGDRERGKRKKQASEREEVDSAAQRPRLDVPPQRPMALDATELLGDEHITQDYNLVRAQLQGDNPDLAARTRGVQPAQSKEGLPAQEPRRLDNFVGDRRALPNRLEGQRTIAVEESHPETASSSKPTRSREKLDEKTAELASKAMATRFKLSREDCEAIGSLALKAFVDNAAALATLEFGGEKLSKGDILTILRNDGAAQAVKALRDKANDLMNMPKSKVLAAASKRGAAAAIRKLK